MMNECSDCGEEFEEGFLDCCPFCESHNIVEINEFQCNECLYIWDNDNDEECPQCDSEEISEL